MENLNAEQVKKALECCNTIGGCKVCPYSCNGKPTDNGECGEKMSLDALALINKQETEYNELYELLQTYKADSEAYRSYSKTLEKENEALKTLLDESYDTQNSLTEENERLTADKDYWQNRAKESESEYDQAVKRGYNLGTADSVGAFAERLKAKAVGFPNYTGEVIAARWVDRIAKEMLEGENG